MTNSSTKPSPGHLLPGVLVAVSCTTAAPVPPPECVNLWAGSAAVEVIDRLTATTAPGDPVWPGYGLEDATLVVAAGESSAGHSCLAVVRAGAVLAYGVTSEAPRFLTPLYGYHFVWELNNGSMEDLVGLGQQPAEIRDWLTGMGVESAVVIPVRVEGFPFEISPLHLAQIGIHEGFHVEVQTPRWLGHDAMWPSWDLQPNRSTVRACYTGSQPIDIAFDRERRALVNVVQSLLDNEPVAACNAAHDFLQRRARRYELVADGPVTGHGGEQIGCESGENIMELEEGTADYASWTVMFQRGQVSREQLIARYEAQQAEVFYLTGAMMLHAVSLMHPVDLDATLEGIASSETMEQGALATVFAREVASYCQ